MRDHWDEEPDSPAPFPSGASACRGSRGWVLIEGAGPRSLGGALIWAARHHLDEMHVLVDGAAEVLASRAVPFSLPVQVWVISGTELRPVAGVPLEPPAAEGPPAVEEFERLGLEVTVEHGVVAGEVLGLEVARFVDGRVEVGVGRFDREMAAMMYADLPPAEALERVVDFVRGHRYQGAPAHPLRDLSPERWLRVVVGTGAGLVPVPTVMARPNLRDPHPALGRGADGLVVCTHGVDPDLLPLAAASRRAGEPLRVVGTSELPRSVREVGRWLEPPVSFEVVDPPWSPAWPTGSGN